MGLLGETWFQLVLVAILIGLGVWWFKFREQY